MSDKYVASIKKALDVLDILALEDIRHEGISLSQLSERTGIKPNTLHAILKTMVMCGYVEQNSKLRYMSGKRCRQIGIISRMKTPVGTAGVLDSELNRLREITDESVSFYVLDHGERINYTNIMRDDAVKVDYTMLEDKSMYWYPSGKVLVSFCSDRERSRIIRKNGMPGDMWDGADTVEKLDAAVEKVRRDGWATLNSPINMVASYAMPVFLSDGSLLGSLGVYMPIRRKTPEKERLIRKAMAECADTIRSKL